MTILHRFGIYFFLSVISIVAQADIPENILESNLPTTCNFSGEFNQRKSLKGLPQPLNSSGSFFFACEHGLIWQTNKPIQETRVYTVENKHFSIKKSQEPVLLEGIANFYLAKFLLSILSGNTESLYKNYHIAIIQDTPLSIELTPKNKYLKKGLKNIAFSKSTSTATINVKITDANLQLTEISVQEDNQYNSKDIIAICRKTYNNDSCSILNDPSAYEDSQSLL